jgi:hypothetical protein
MRRSLKSWVRFMTIALTVTSASWAAENTPTAPGSSVPYIVNGLFTSQYPTTGALLDSANFNFADLICSGTLIGCRTFLTAGHCVESSLNPANYSVFLQHAGMFTVSSVALHPSYDFPVADVAVLTLTTPVNGIAPTPINVIGTPPYGTPATIVGFGRSGGGSNNADYGLKRAGDVVTAQCTGGISNSTSVCWNFSDPVGAPGTDSNTCNGDSGGPLLTDLGSGVTVAGVTSGGTSASCLPTDHSYDANVFYYREWIQSIAGADLNNTSCGTLPQVGSSGATVTGIVGTLNSVATEGVHTIDVPPGISALRIAMNAIDNGSDYDLYVRFGAPATTSLFDCQAAGPNQFGACNFPNPSVGTWHILVNRFSGSGSYQVTATTFGVDCSNPSNAGLPCDDGNVCTEGDACQNGSCAGSQLPNGTPCDDRDSCTQPDACQAGLCTGGEEPRVDCIGAFVPHRGLLRLQKPQGHSQRLNWSWTHGSLTSKSDFGTPTANTNYDFCIFDQAGGVNHLAYRARLAGGAVCSGRPCWVESTQGFKYRDVRASNGSISGLVLKEGANGKARIMLKGKGDGLNLPMLPLTQQSTVTVQLGNGTRCWNARFGTNSVNTTLQFKAKPN